MSNKIEIRDLYKSYDGKKNILEGINLDIKEKEFFILVGPSGCGKSTLLRIICGLESITSGTLIMDGRVANELPPKDRNLSMVFQSYALYPHMTVRENALFGLDVKKVPKAEQEERLKEAAEMLGLTEYLDRKPRALSGGQRQRVALARSVCSHAPICLMDEPLSNLDAKLRGHMRYEIRRLQRRLGLTVIYVTHDQVEAMTMGDRITVLSNGLIQQTGTPLELYNKPANMFVAGFIGAPQMNFAEASVEDGRLVLNKDFSVSLSAVQLERLPQSGKRWKVGIRPEQLALAPADDKSGARINAVVRSTEMMGNETQVIFSSGDTEFTARWQGQYILSIGQQIQLSCTADDFHFFDIESEKLICPAFNIQKNTLSADEVG